MALQDTVRDREIAAEQRHMDRVYRRLDEKLQEAEFLLADAGKIASVATPGALAERDAMVYRAGRHLQRLNSEFEDFVFGRIDLLGNGGGRGIDLDEDTAPDDADPEPGPEELEAAGIGEVLHIGRLGVLDADYAPLVVDWRAPAAAPFYRATPVRPGRVVRRRVIRSLGRKVLGVEDDLLRPDLAETVAADLPVVGDGALMAALGRARGHAMRDIVSSIQAEQDEVVRAPAGGVTEVRGGPGTGKTAVALHRAAYLLYTDRRRYSGAILVVSPTPLLVAYTEGVLPSLGEEGQVSVRALGDLVDGVEAQRFDTPELARIKGSARMARVLRGAARAAMEAVSRADHGDPAARGLRVTAGGRTLRLSPGELAGIRRTVLGGTAPVNSLRPRARRLLLDALYAKLVAELPAPSDAAAAAEHRADFNADAGTEAPFMEFLEGWWPALTPRRVLAALGDRRLLARAAGRVLTRAETDALAADLRRGTSAAASAGRGDGLTVHDVALLDELRVQLGVPPEPARPREPDALEELGGVEEVRVWADRMDGRGGAADDRERDRTEYTHLIVDEAQDLTPMQWRMVGRRGAHATWTVVGDPAQSSWIDTEEARAAREEALGSRRRRAFTLTVNYRNSAEMAAVADRVLRLAAPGTEPPRAVRSTGVSPRFGAVRSADDVRAEVARLLGEVDGTVGVVVPMARRAEARGWVSG
ncbi:helicase, partial [Mangrovactinospora gilvigrisea]